MTPPGLTIQQLVEFINVLQIMIKVLIGTFMGFCPPMPAMAAI
jgi:hypothetical protein